MCQRWRDSFAAFAEDMGLPPTNRHTIDRIDVNGNYEPGNVRWADKTEQSQNRRNVRNISHNGVTACIAEWSRRTGIADDLIRARINRGWSPARAMGAA